MHCYRDRFEGRALGLGVNLLLGGRRESLAAGNSLVFAVEKLILAAETGLFSSEGYRGAPAIKCYVRALSIEVWPCGKVWLPRGNLKMGEQRMWMEYSKWWKWFSPPRGHTSWCYPYLLALSNPKNRWGGGVPPPVPPPGAPLRGADKLYSSPNSK
jgi:hypothetical protein